METLIDSILKILFNRLKCTFGPPSFTNLRFWPPSLKIALLPLKFHPRCKTTIPLDFESTKPASAKPQPSSQEQVNDNLNFRQCCKEADQNYCSHKRDLKVSLWC